LGKKFLVLVNWHVHRKKDQEFFYQSPNIILQNRRYWFFNYWPERDIETEVIDYSRFPIVHFFEKNIFRFYVIQGFKALTKLEKYDILISHGVQSAIVLAFIRSFLGINYPPHIIIDVGCLNGGRSRQPELILFQFAMNSVSGLIYHAKSQKKHYDKYFPKLARRSIFVPFGVDTEFFKPLDLEQENYILSVGYKFRDWRTLINAYSKIRTNTMLKIVGPKKLNIKLPENVSVIPYVPINILKELIARAKFIVLPLINLPYAHGQMTLLQSMAMGKAVIVTKVASTVDYIKDYQNALFVKYNDISDMKDKIEFLLSNPNEIIRLGRNAQMTIENKFTEKHMAEVMYEAIRLIISY